MIDLRGAAAGAVGAQLQHYAQQNGLAPQIPLGSSGRFTFGRAEPLPWQVVGYVERCEVANGEGDAQSFWREYLLYNRVEGFAFIVDAEDGWSWSAPITGVPQIAGAGMRWQGADYRKLYDYTGMVTYVLGEFYWQVTQNQRTANTDYQGTGRAAARRLNREATVAGQGGAEATREIVWSAGETLSADQVMKGFGLAPAQQAAFERDTLPTTFGGASLLWKILLWVVIVLVVLGLFRCAGSADRIDCNPTQATYGAASQEYRNCLNDQRSGGGYRTGGGAFGGFATGGGHK